MAIIPPLVIIIIESLVLKYSYLLHFIASRYAYMANTWRYFMGLMNGEGAHRALFVLHGKSVGVTKVFMPSGTGLDISTLHYTVAALIGLGVGIVFLFIAGRLAESVLRF